ncbi:membrane protein, partial [Mycobacterium numidiamassiliense]
VTEHVETMTPEPVGPPAPSRPRGTGIAVLGLVLTGIVIGALWAWIAPPIHVVVAMTRSGERVHDYLGTESDHFFDLPCLMLGLLTVLAVVTPVLVWQWRRLRGPAMVVAVSIGMVIAAVAASGVGALLVRLRYGALNVDAVPLLGHPSVAYVVEAPPVFFGHGPLQVAITLVWPAAIAALVYAVLAAGNARDDLGAVPLEDHSPPLAIEPDAPEAAVS